MKSSRLSAGSFASERAFALMWQGIDSIVIEVELSDKFYRKGMRIEPGLECSQFELLEGVVIPPDELRRVSEEELIEDRKYLKSLNRSKRSPHVRTEF